MERMAGSWLVMRLSVVSLGKQWECLGTPLGHILIEKIIIKKICCSHLVTEIVEAAAS